METFEKLKDVVLAKLKNGLPDYLTYHDLNHVLDVLDACEMYIKKERVVGDAVYLLKIGALVHDIGFISSNVNHEEVGAKMAGEIMLDFGFDEMQIQVVKGLILATKIPQKPKTILQKILCDADLDYLGRDDYPEISLKLYHEFMATGVIKTKEDWKNLQINFLKNHRYHTDWAKAKREPKKQEWLLQIQNGTL